MTVATSVSRTTVYGNASATSFAYTFPIQSSSHLVVIRTTAAGVDTTLTLGTHYSVTGVGDAGGGSITYPLSGSALPSGDRLTMLRSVPLTQLTDLTNQGAFYAEVHESEFDLLCMANQQLDERLDRALLVPASDVDALTEMPSAAARASKYLAFDSSGNPIATAGAASGTPVSTWAATLLDDTSALAALATLGVPLITAALYGAVGNGIADDTGELQAALDAATSRGGTVDIGDGRYLIGSDLTIPAGVTLRGHWRTPGDLTTNAGVYGGTAPTFSTMGSALLLGSGVTITLSAGGAMEGLLVMRNGVNHPVTSDSSFSGTAVEIDGDDCYIGYCMFLGHTLAINSSLQGRHKFEWLAGDCSGGIKIADSYDVTRITDCHFWPYLSANTGAAIPESYHHRDGAGFDFDGMDIGVVTNCFAFGYYRGFRLTRVGAGTFTGCATDGTLTLSGSIGYDIGLGTGGATGSRFIGCTAFSAVTGFWINIPVNDYISLTQCQCSAISNTGIYIASGDVGIVGGFLAATTANVHVNNALSKVSIVGTRFNSASAPITSLSRFIEVAGIDTGLYTGGASLGTPGPRQITSADPLVITAVGSFFEVLGTTNFATITAGYPGRQIILKFAGILTVTDGTPIKLAGNFVTAANSTLTLVSDGTNWFECARSTN